MSEFKETFNSSLGKKLIMALTGLLLCTFLIVHVGGNLLLFKRGMADIHQGMVQHPLLSQKCRPAEKDDAAPQKHEEIVR